MKIQYKILAHFFSALLIAFIGSASVLAAPAITVGNGAGVRDQTIMVPVTLSNNESVVGVQFDLVYDATKLVSGAAVYGDAINQGLAAIHITEPTLGTRRAVIRPLNGVASIGSGALVTIPFTVKPTAVLGASALTLTRVMTSDLSGVNAGASVTSGNFLIVNPSDTTTDRDGDGLKDKVEYDAGLDPFNAQDATADFDGDGLANNMEIAFGTDLRVFDTDGDGVGDNSDSFPLDITRWSTTPAPPVAVSGQLDVIEQVVTTGKLTGRDPNGNSLIYSIQGSPAKGAVQIINTSTGAYTYTSNPLQLGSDSFTFRVFDGTSYSSAATVSVNIVPSGGTLQPRYAWTRVQSGYPGMNGRSMAVDKNENVYVYGYFNGDGDFDGDGDSDVTSLGSFDLYLTRIGAENRHSWTRTFRNIKPKFPGTVAVDGSNNVYITGRFEDTVDFNEDGGSPDRQSAYSGSSDAFVTKILADGRYGWTRTFGNYSFQSGHAIATDESGNAYVIGTFEGNVDINKDGVNDLVSTGQSDIFVVKFDTDGRLLWAVSLGGTLSDSGDAIAVTDSGDIYITGYANANFSASPPVYEDLFIAKLSAASGAIGWSHTLGGIYPDVGYSIVADTSGHVYVSGFSYNRFDYNPGSGTDIRGVDIQVNVFLTKYDSNGNYLWARTYVPPVYSGNGYSLAIDADDIIYLTAGEGFYKTYDQNGNNLSAITIGTATGSSVAVSGIGNIYVMGGYSGNVDFDPGPGIDEYYSAIGGNVFLTKYSSVFELLEDMDGDGIITYYDPFPYNPSEIFDNDDDGIGNNQDRDDDGDRLFDAFELAYNFNPISIDSNQDTIPDAVSNEDTDNLTNYQESVAGTNPRSNDSDQDGVLDHNEGFVNRLLFGPVYDRTRPIHVSVVLTDMKVDTLGDTYITGAFSESVDLNGDSVFDLVSRGFNDVFLVKLNAAGAYERSWTMGGPRYDMGREIFIDTSGNVYLTGEFQGQGDFNGDGIYERSTPGTNDYDVFLTRIDKNGSYSWTKTYGVSADEQGVSVQIDKDGNVYVGLTDGLIKTTTDSAAGWVYFDTGTSNTRVVLDSFGNVYASGYYYESNGNTNSLITRILPNGITDWSMDVAGTGYDYAWVGQVTDDGSFYLFGGSSFNGGRGGSIDFNNDDSIEVQTAGFWLSYIAKFNSDRTIAWIERYKSVNLMHSAMDKDGMLYFTGFFQKPEDFDKDGVDEAIPTPHQQYPELYTDDTYLLKLNPQGAYVWHKVIGGGGQDIGYRVAVDSQNNVHHAGTFIGTVNFNRSGNDTYTSTNNFVDFFVSKYSVANNAPVAQNTSISLSEDGTYNGVLPATDVNGDSLVYSIIALPTKGTLTLLNAATGAFTYVPNANLNGGDSFTFSVNDGRVVSNVATVNVTISVVNDPPVANGGTITTNEGVSLSSTLTSSDVDTTSRTYQIVTNGAKGIVTITSTANGSYTYTPNAGINGADSFSFRVYDGTNYSLLAVISVNIIAVNTPPVANAGSNRTVNEGAVVTLTGSGTDSDGTIQSFRWNQTAGPVVTLNNFGTAAPSFTVPEVTANSTLTFELTVTDNESATAKDSIDVQVTNTTLADLRVTSISGSASGAQGEVVTINDSVINQGVGAAGEFSVNIYLSTDTTINASDTLLDARVVGGITASISSIGATSVTIPFTLPVGNYYLGAIVDSSNQVVESNEGNNVLLGSVFAVMVGESTAFQQDSGADGLVSMEAEHSDANVSQGGYSWLPTTTPVSYSSQGAMKSDPNTGGSVNTGYVTGSPRLDFKVNFVKTGTHYVWIRGAAPDNSGDSLHVGIDNTAVTTSDRIHDFGNQTGVFNTWYWSRVTMDSGALAIISDITLGEHTINVWMREDGVIVDKVVLTTNSAYTPTGTGPVESPRGGGTEIVATPTITPNGGVILNSDTITLATSTAGAAIYYTADGTTPTFPVSGTTQQYSTAFTLPGAIATVRAIGVKAGFTNSAEVSASFNRRPVFDSTPITSATVGTLYNYTAHATDADGHTLTYSLTLSPTDMTITSGGVISWTPTSGQVGNHNITVRVMDSGTPAAMADQSFTITVAAAGGGSSFQQDSGADGLVSMEAEHFDANVSQGGHNWLLTTTPAGYSGEGAMKSDPDTTPAIDANYTTGSPRLDLRVNFVKTGTHYVWIRGAAPNNSGDSAHVGIDNTAIATSDRIHNFGNHTTPAVFNTWYWSRVTMDSSALATINILTLGEHTINVWMREDGVIVDKVVLTTNSAYTPTGAGPVESQRGGGTEVVATPTITPNGGVIVNSDTITLATSTVDAEIRYTTNGSEPNPTSSLYSTPFALAGTTATTVRAIGVKAGFTNSAEASASFNRRPVFDSTPVMVATVGVAYSYTAHATDADGHTLTYSLTQAPTDMAITSGGVISWTPTSGQVGSQNVIVRVTDSGTPAATVDQPFTITVAAAGGGSAFQQDSGADGLVSIEAAHFDANVTQGGYSWLLTTTPTGYSSEGAMRSNPNSGGNINTGYVMGSPRLDFKVNFVKTGTHYVWIRGAAPDNASDSLHVGIDNTAIATSDRIHDFGNQTGVFNTWYWSRNTMDGASAFATINITSSMLGEHTINVWMREDGVIVDKVVLTTNSAYTPTGTGPVESPRGGLITHLGFDETSGTTVYDYSGNNNDGQVVGATFIAGHIGYGALSFDGVGDYVDVANEAAFDFESTDPFTLEAWINTTNAASVAIISKIFHVQPYRGYELRLTSSGVLFFYLVNTWSTSVAEIQGTTVVTDGAWHHVFATYDGSSAASGLKLYIDGTPETIVINKDTLTGTILTDTNLRIGARPNQSINAFIDSIDDVHVYNRELSAAEIAQ